MYKNFLVVSLFILVNSQDYDVPDPKLEAFQPRGFRFSIPDEKGIRLVAIHANINQEIEDLETGQIAHDIVKKKGERWIYENRNLKLKVGDVINYWIHVIYNGLGYNRLGLTWTVTEYSTEEFPYKTSTTTPKPDISTNCPNALTTVNGIGVCSNKLIFEETFSSNHINSSIWRWQQRLADKPDFKFQSYMKKDTICFLKDNQLVIKPEVLSNEEIERGGVLNFPECTAPKQSQCRIEASQRTWNILPPVRSARLSTDQSFSFKYGTIEIEAQLPRGDWLTPEIWLSPKKNFFGEDLTSGQIRIAFSRGNHIFKDLEEVDYGCIMLQAGILLRRSDRIVQKLPQRMRNSGCWNDELHNFKLIWRPEYVEFRVDEQLIGRIVPPNEGWKSLRDWDGLTDADPWANGSKMSPFDQEFFIELGVGVGGFLDFPDLPRSSKPWQNKETKAQLKFFQNKDSWLPTWTPNGSLKVKSVRVWSL